MPFWEESNGSTLGGCSSFIIAAVSSTKFLTTYPFEIMDFISNTIYVKNQNNSKALIR